MLHICIHAQIIVNVGDPANLAPGLSLDAAMGEAVGGVGPRWRRKGASKLLVQLEGDSLEAIATELFGEDPRSGACQQAPRADVAVRPELSGGVLSRRVRAAAQKPL